ncbi:hypothetical protein LCGC14_1438170 [marine sediment metagenome]|uniref:NTP pyrophosphohydrolase MazG-like domain-containing protein n=1 Tax=marine sediment metagenome TaxID=412755 RepID=A0A0F9JLG7_9ZZZZ
MTLKEYEKFVRDFWIGPKDPQELSQLFIATAGLGGEAGEVLEKLKKYVRDGELDKALLEKELGDVLYYLTMIACMFDSSLESVMAANVNKLTVRLRDGKMRGSGDER